MIALSDAVDQGGRNSVAAALLGAGALAVMAAVTGFSALLTSAVIGLNALRD